jgi:hypothetical protein
MTVLDYACSRNIRDTSPDVFSRHIGYCANIIHDARQQSALLLLRAPRSDIRAYPNVVRLCLCTPNIVGVWFQFIENDLNKEPRCERQIAVDFGYALCDTLALVK